MTIYMKKSIKYTLLTLATALLTVGLGSCSDWTDTESLNVKNPTFEDQNSKLYQDYLKDLRAYKTSDHKVLFVTYSNPINGPIKQAERLTVIPDSVDYISLTEPAKVHADTQAEMKKIRNEKGTRVVYTINYDAIEAEWEDKAKGNPELTEEEALEYMGAKFTELIALSQKFDFDGIVLEYTGRSTVSMTEPVLERYDNRQKNLFNKITEWKNQNESKTLAFYGNVQYLVNTNMSVLDQADFIILKTERVLTPYSVTLQAYMASQAGKDAAEATNGPNYVHTDRFVACVQLPLVGEPNSNVGYWNTPDGKILATIGGAQWAVEESLDFGRKGLFITSINNDYYNNTYKSIRNVISIMNPNK